MREVILVIDKQRHRGWQSVSITRGLDSIATEFDLTLTDNWGNGRIATVRAGQPCQLYLGNELLLTGYTDEVSPSYDARSHSINVRGRSKTGDLVDCTLLKQQEFPNQKLDQIAKSVCAKYGIDVIIKADVGNPFKKAKIDTGQPILEFLEYLARIRAVRLVTTPEGNLQITNTGTTFSQTTLVYGKNIKSARGTFDLSQAFSNYTIASSDSDEVFVQPDVSANAADNRVSRFRQLTTVSNDSLSASDASARAQWEANTRWGRSQSATYTVTGWQQTVDGPTWVPNQLVRVTDPFLKINGQRLITETRLILDDQGSRTEITVMPKEAFSLIPLPDPEEGGWQ